MKYRDDVEWFEVTDEQIDVVRGFILASLGER